MSESAQIASQPSRFSAVTFALICRPAAVFWLQGITLLWMLVECGLSLYAAAAAAAHSPAMLAFGPIVSWSFCPREWCFCSFCLMVPFPDGAPPELLAPYCSLLL